MINYNKLFSYFETTADIGICVESLDINSAFGAAAYGTLDIVTDMNKIKTVIQKNINIESEDIYALLYDWITELIILLESEQFIGSNYDINIKKVDSSYILSGSIMGDIYNTEYYNYKTEVKAITYHKMNLEKKDNIYKLRFILDL